MVIQSPIYFDINTGYLKKFDEFSLLDPNFLEYRVAELLAVEQNLQQTLTNNNEWYLFHGFNQVGEEDGHTADLANSKLSVSKFCRVTVIFVCSFSVSIANKDIEFRIIKNMDTIITASRVRIFSANTNSTVILIRKQSLNAGDYLRVFVRNVGTGSPVLTTTNSSFSI